MRGPTVAVTGATGFIGQHVVVSLLAQGADVLAIVRRDGVPLPAGVHPVVVPALEHPGAVETLARSLRKVDAVVHLAGRAHLIRDPSSDPLEEFRLAHVHATRVLVEAMEHAGVPRLVALSTAAAAVGGTTGPVDDRVSAAPTTPYGRSKREMEILLSESAARAGLGAVILRPPMVYGAGMKGNPARLMRLLVAKRPIPVPNPPGRRSAVFVGNLTQAIYQAVVNGSLTADPYFICDGPAPSTVEFIQAMAGALNERPRIVRVPRAVLRVMGRAGDFMSRVAPIPFTTYEVQRLLEDLELDGSRFWKDAGVRAQHTLQSGMRETAAWLRSSQQSSMR